MTTQTELIGTYSDERGLEPVVMTNNGTWLRTTIRGVCFEGRDFDGLSPVDGDATGFTLHHGDLCNCTFDLWWDIPISIGDVDATARLRMILELGVPSESRGIDRETVTLELTFGAHRLRSSGETGWFEPALDEIVSQLPSGVRLKTCFVCQFSDYSPYGNGLFGTMLCFRNMKDAYVATRG